MTGFHLKRARHSPMKSLLVFCNKKAMGHNLWLHCGVDEHPFATYFDVHQGYRVWTHSQITTRVQWRFARKDDGGWLRGNVGHRPGGCGCNAGDQGQAIPASKYLHRDGVQGLPGTASRDYQMGHGHLLKGTGTLFEVLKGNTTLWLIETEIKRNATQIDTILLENTRQVSEKRRRTRTNR